MFSEFLLRETDSKCHCLLPPCVVSPSLIKLRQNVSLEATYAFRLNEEFAAENVLASVHWVEYSFVPQSLAASLAHPRTVLE